MFFIFLNYLNFIYLNGKEMTSWVIKIKLNATHIPTPALKAVIKKV